MDMDMDMDMGTGIDIDMDMNMDMSMPWRYILLKIILWNILLRLGKIRELNAHSVNYSFNSSKSALSFVNFLYPFAQFHQDKKPSYTPTLN